MKIYHPDNLQDAREIDRWTLSANLGGEEIVKLHLVEDELGLLRAPILQDLNLPGIINIYGFVTVSNKKYIITEHFEKVNFNSIRLKEKKELLFQIGNILNQLHAKKVYWGWLSPKTVVQVGAEYKLARFTDGMDIDFYHPTVINKLRISKKADRYSYNKMTASLLSSTYGLKLKSVSAPSISKLMRHYCEPETVKVPSIILKITRKKTALALMMTFSLLLVGLTTTHPDLLKETFLILQNQGIEPALRFLGTTKTNTFNDLYTRAWVHYYDLNLEKASVILQELNQRALDTKQRGKLLYLQGYIFLSQGKAGQALNSFSESKEIFDSFNDVAQIHRLLLGIANVYMELEDWELAGTYLNQAEFYAQKGVSLGILYQLRAHTEFKKGNHFEAYKYSKLELVEFEGDKIRAAQALSDMGFYAMVLGMFSEGLDKTNQSNMLAVNMGHKDTYYFNLPNQIYFARCHGYDYSVLVDSVYSYTEETGNEKLLDHLEDALNLDCGEGRVGIVLPDPPIDPDDDPGSGG